MATERRGFRAVLATALAGIAFAASPAELATLRTASGIAADPFPQDDRDAAEIRRTLARIRLPAGFHIELFARVPDARQLAVAPAAADGSRPPLLVVGTRRAGVWTVRPGTDGAPATVRPLAPDIDWRLPNGACWTLGGDLVLVEHNRILRLPDAVAALARPEIEAVVVVPQGGLIPPSEEASNHGARTCKVGPDGLLYVPVGQPFNVPPRDKLALYDRTGIGGIVRLSPVDGSRREVFARGLRNSVGLDFNPRDGSLWFTDNQVDRMGDDIPRGEINRATAPGQFFGFPWTNSRTRITAHGYDRDPLPRGIVEPQVETVAHAADLGLAFYTGTQFPPEWRGGFFSAQHGSWNRSVPVGAQVLFTVVKPDGTAGATTPFATGWLDEASGRYRGRPVDVAVWPDGSLLVSDDHAGAIYRIRHVP